MDAKLKRLAVTLTITMIFLSFTLANVKVAFSSDTSGKIDLFTQKAPYNGKGPNMPSDAFGPGEEVEIYALVTYRDSPVEGYLVAFEASGPQDPVENITIVRTALTNEDGIAMISFRIAVLNTTTFGEWMVLGNVMIGDSIFQDVVSFKVGWIVQIVSMRTVNENLIEQTKFTRGSLVGIEVVLQNIALTEESVTLAITIHDHLNVLINSTEINNFVVQPNGTLVYAYRFLSIPRSALLGEAVAYACAYTAPVSMGGVPCCLEASRHFLIVNRDIAILNVQPSPTVVLRGGTIKIDVNVKNKGEEIESFNVSTYYNETLAGTSFIVGLQPGLNTTISFIWNTSLVLEGFYQISASASPVPNEIDLSDNTFVDGVVEVLARPPIHDVSVLSVIPSSTFVYIGETVDINVIVKNYGIYAESFNITAFCNSTAIETLPVENLEPNAERTLLFHWNTQNIAEGNYTLRASASVVPGEENLENNSYVDGVVEVIKGPKEWLVPDWFYWLLPLVLAVIVLLIVWLYLRKRRKKAGEAFYSGWTAWYYGYDLRSKKRKI